MDKSSESLTPVAKTRSWRASNCSCSDYDYLEGLESRNLIVCPYEACVTSKSCPLYIHSNVPIDTPNFYNQIFTANESHQDITGNQKPQYDQNLCVDVIKRKLPENENLKTVRGETNTNLKKDDNSKIGIQDLDEITKSCEQSCKGMKNNKTKTNLCMLSHNLKETSPTEKRQYHLQKNSKSCTDSNKCHNLGKQTYKIRETCKYFQEEKKPACDLGSDDHNKITSQPEHKNNFVKICKWDKYSHEPENDKSEISLVACRRINNDISELCCGLRHSTSTDCVCDTCESPKVSPLYQKEANTNSLKQIFKASATYHDTTKMRSNQNLKDKETKDTLLEMKAKGICSRKECKDIHTKDRNTTKHGNLVAFKEYENRYLDASYAEGSINHSATRTCKLQSTMPSKVINKVQKMLTEELSKETNEDHTDSLARINKCLEEKKTRQMSCRDINNQEVYLDKNINYEFDKSCCHPMSLNVCHSNKVVMASKSNDKEVEGYSPCSDNAINNLPEKLNIDDFYQVYARPQHDKKSEISFDSKLIPDETKKYEQNHEMTSNSKPIPKNENKDEFHQNYLGPRRGQNYDITNHSKPLLKENIKDCRDVYSYYKKTTITNGQRLPIDKLEDKLHSFPKNIKTSEVTKFNIRRAIGEKSHKHQPAVKSCFANDHKYNMTPVKKYTKFCPAYCPICHKLYIEEQNDDLAKKTRVPFKECRKCFKTIHKITPKEDKQENKLPEGNISPDNDKIQTDCKTNDLTERENVYSATAGQNGYQITKNENCTSKCFVPNDQSYICKTKDIRHDSVTCNSLYKTQNSITNQQKECIDDDNVRLQNNIDMMTYIKDCIHEEIEDIRRSLLEGNKTNDNNNGCSWKKIQPSTHDRPADCHNALYENSHEIKTDTKKDNFNCYMNRKIQNISHNHNKPLKQAIQENPPALIENFKDFIYKDILGNNTGQIENTPKGTYEQTYYDDPTTTKRVYSTTKTDEKHTFAMRTNINKIDPGTTNGLEIKPFNNQPTIRSKYYQSSAFVSNKTPTSKSYGTSADELTAQIMNVPYKLYKKIARLEMKPVRSIGLLQKVKEMYAACSCKMCECISSSPIMTNTETCSCKPCDCLECRAKAVYSFSKYNNWMTNANNNNKVHQKQAHSDLSACQCKPCDCIKCKKDSSQKPCGCKPCECTECKSMGLNKKTNFIVASVRDNQERPYCQCSPCGCFDCAHPFGTATPTHNSQETGTDDRRHMNCDCDNCVNDNCEQEGIDTCTCERHSKLMSKPVTNDKKEFDIHYVVHKTTNLKSFLHPPNEKGGAVSIYTSLTHQIFCPRKAKVDDSLNSADNSKYSSTVSSRIVNMLPQDYWALRASAAMMSNSLRNCNCKPCDCQKCKQHFLERHIPNRRSSCCEVCECINYATLNVSYGIEKKYSKNHNDPLTTQQCSCKPCDCIDCTKYRITSIHDNSRLYDNTYLRCKANTLVKDNTRSNHFLKLLRASDSERYIELILSDKETKNRNLINDDCNSSRTLTFLNDSEDMKLYRTDIHNIKNNLYCKQHQRTNLGFTNITDKNYRTDEIEHDSVVNHNTQHSHKNIKREEIKMNFQISDKMLRLNSTVLSGAASLEPTYYVSKCSKLPKNQEFSADSSCNSIGHDSNYSLHKPTSTVETCINDVMNLRLYHKSNTDYSKPNVITKSYKANSESTTNTLKRYNKYPLHGLDVIDKNGIVQLVDNDNTISDHFTIDKSCQCKLCDCGDCLNKLPKLISCQFDFAACGRDGSCQNENTILIRQNESTQTAKLELNSEEDMSKKNPSLMKKWNVSFSDNDRIIRWADIPAQNYLRNTLSNAARTEYLSINYDSVRRTIKEAKQFSLQLLNILQKYEKANKDFDRLTDKFKKLQEPLLDQVIEHRKLVQAKSTERSSNDESVSDIEIKRNKLYNSNKLELRNGKLARKKSNYNLKNDHQEIDSSLQPDTNRCEINEHTTSRKAKIEENITKIKAVPIQKNVVNHNQCIIKQGHDKRYKIDLNSSSKIDQLSMQLTKSEEKSNFENLKIEFKKYSQHLDIVLDKFRTNVWGVKKSTIASSLDKPVLSEKKSRPNNKAIELPKNSKLLPEGTSSTKKSIDNNSSDLNTVFICHSHKDHVNNHKELKSTNSIHQQLDSCTVVTNLDTLVPKRFKTSHHTQMSHTSNDVQSQARLCRAFESAPSMGSKRFLDWVARSNANTSITSNLLRNSSHNPMKVVFQTVRVLSEHSILLKWKIPDDTTNIEGYEILVDGRSVQRIMCPSKNIAALSCLPHSEKLKLTVRTLTKPAPAGPLPSATVVVSTRP